MTALCYRNFKHPMPTRSLVFVLCVLFNSIFSTKRFLITLLVSVTLPPPGGHHSHVCCLQHLLKKMLQFIQPIPSNSFALSRYYIISILYSSFTSVGLVPQSALLPKTVRFSFCIHTQTLGTEKEISHPSIFTVHNGHQPRQRRTRIMKSVRGAWGRCPNAIPFFTPWAVNFSRCSSFA